MKFITKPGSGEPCMESPRSNLVHQAAQTPQNSNQQWNVQPKMSSCYTVQCVRKVITFVLTEMLPSLFSLFLFFASHGREKMSFSAYSFCPPFS